MKYLLLTISLLALCVIVAKLSHYSERMETYNAHMCAVTGYEPDCKTPLKGGN